ncbi:ABC transporter permease [Dehalococcoidia bacterium]|nr:ABC transporter permease [Dehalococcoidia bacterium]
MSDGIGIPSAEIAPKRRSRLADFFIRLVREKPLGTACGIIILILIFMAVFANVLMPYPYDQAHIRDMMKGPSAQFLLGTDQLGRDSLSRLMYGARMSLLVGLTVTTISVGISTLIGGSSGFLMGKFDMFLQRFCDAWEVFPYLLILLTVMSVVGQGLVQTVLVMGIAGGLGGSRIIRSAVIAIKENDYFLAAEAIGNPKWRAFLRHVIPNIMPVVIIAFTISVGGVILSLASLSFLGFGLPVGTPDWGGMLSAEGRTYMEQAPRIALFPGLALTLTVYCLNMFGDALRDLLDPRLRGG